MDNVVLALSVAIAVILVLLLSCWDGKPKKSKPRRRVVDNNAMPPAREGMESTPHSLVGQGAVNRKATNRYNKLGDLAGYDDFNAVAQFMALEPEVFESQERYSNDMNRSTSGPSMLSETDHRNDVVPFVGLRRPDYQGVYADQTARVEHSEIPDQMPMRTSYVIG